MNELLWIEGPVIKSGGELVLFVTLAKECSGLPSSSEFAECIKLVIPRNVAEAVRIEVGDMVCIRGCEGVLHLQAVKAGVS